MTSPTILSTPEAPVKRGAATDEPLTYVYLSSVEHSGSTLLACLLGAHPALTTVGEFGSTRISPNGKCSCGELYRECKFWRTWQRLAEEAGVEFSIDKLRVSFEPGPQAGFFEKLFYHQFPYKWIDRVRDLCFRISPKSQRHWRLPTDRCARLARVLCRDQGSNVFLDTTKYSRQIRFLARNRDIRLKMIALVRDGRGVMNSLMKKESRTADHAIDSWIYGNRHLERASRYLSAKNIFRLRLEELCAAPERTIAELFEFCGVEPVANLDFSRADGRHVIGNTMRLTFDGTIKLDKAWKRDLSAKDLKLFEEKAGWLNRKLGYLV